VFDIFSGKYCQIGGSSAKVKKGGAQLFFFVCQHGLAGCQGFQDDIADIESGSIGAFYKVVGRCDRTGDDVNFSFQPNSGHSHRVLDTRFIIDNKLLGQDMDDFAIHWNRYCPGGIDHPLDIVFRDLRSFDGNNSTTVKSGDVTAGNTGIHRGYFTACHEFCFLHRLFNRFHGGFDIDDDTFAKSDGWMGPDTDNIDVGS